MERSLIYIRALVEDIEKVKHLIHNMTNFEFNTSSNYLDDKLSEIYYINNRINSGNCTHYIQSLKYTVKNEEYLQQLRNRGVKIRIIK